MGTLTADEKFELTAVYNALPPARIRTYLQQTGGNPYAALALYNHNSKIAAAVFETIGHFEIDFRSRIDRALSERHSYIKRTGDWLENNHSELSDRAAEAIDEARRNATDHRRTRHGNHPGERGHIIAELNLSFWRRLIDARYERFHGSTVMRLYPTLRETGRARNDMAPLRDLVEPIYALRNRIAHHEPVWRAGCINRRDDMVALIGAGSPELARWVRAHSQLEVVSAQRDASPWSGGPRTS